MFWHAKYTHIVVLLNISGKPGDVTGTGGNYGSMAPGVRPLDDNRRKFLCFFFLQIYFYESIHRKLNIHTYQR